VDGQMNNDRIDFTTFLKNLRKISCRKIKTDETIFISDLKENHLTEFFLIL